MEFNREYYDKVKRLADYIVSSTDPKMKWMWGEALLGYALSELDLEEGREDYTAFLTEYCDIWAGIDPAVDQSDTAAPGLITYAMYKKTGNPEYKRLTDKVLDYIRYAVTSAGVVHQSDGRIECRVELENVVVDPL